MKNIYDGVVSFDNNSEAVIEMPEWLGSLNRDFRYLVTALGAPMPGLYIAEELTNNRFKISGGIAGMKVSWQVTGIRQDAGDQNRIKVEEEKPARERGVDWANQPELMREMKQRRLDGNQAGKPGK